MLLSIRFHQDLWLHVELKRVQFQNKLFHAA